jgi:hypothetical protein
VKLELSRNLRGFCKKERINREQVGVNGYFIFFSGKDLMTEVEVIRHFLN